METTRTADELIHGDVKYGQYLTFTCRNELFSVYLDRIKEVVEFERITSIPLTPDILLGVMNLRGKLMPVIDLSYRLFSEKSEVKKSNRIIIFDLKHKDEALEIGMLVDSVENVVNILDDDISPNPEFGSSVNPEFISNIASINNEFIVMVNIENILNVEEISRIVGKDYEGITYFSTDTEIDEDLGLKDKVEEVEIEENEFVTLKIGNEVYAIEMERLSEIMGLSQMTHVPNALPFMKGVVNLRGTIIPIVDLRSRCNLPEKEPDKKTSILIIDVAGVLIGTIVDSVSNVTRIPANSMQHPPHYTAQIEKDFIKGMAELDDKIIIIIDVDKILTPKEINDFEESDFDTDIKDKEKVKVKKEVKEKAGKDNKKAVTKDAVKETKKETKNDKSKDSKKKKGK
ncbi:chemotaxis protein CheW [Spirochaetota bacterium]